MSKIPEIEKALTPPDVIKCIMCHGQGTIDVGSKPVFKRADSNGVGRTLHARGTKTGKIHKYRPVVFHGEREPRWDPQCTSAQGLPPMVTAEGDDLIEADLCKTCFR